MAIRQIKLRKKNRKSYEFIESDEEDWEKYSSRIPRPIKDVKIKQEGVNSKTKKRGRPRKIRK